MVAPPAPSDISEPSTSAKENLFGCILASEDAYFCSQQRDSEDLNDSAKLEILDELFRTKPGVFLQRYFRLIRPEHKKYFAGAVDQYSLDFYFTKVAQRTAPSKRCNAGARNVRYLALLKLKADGDYFSNAKMREREPFLFDKMVGRFLTDEEKVHLRPTVENTGTLSGLLEEFDQAQRVSDRRQDELSDWSSRKGRQPMPHLLAQASTSRSVADSILRHADQRMGVDNDFEPEFESDDESEEALKSVARKMQKVAVKHEDEEYKPMEEEESASGSSMDEGDDTLGQDMLREEFISHMEQRFLNRKDEEFYDYAAIEGSTSKETDRIHEQDLEDKYFDED